MCDERYPITELTRLSKCSIWDFQVKCWSIMTPRCLCFSTMQSGVVVPGKVKGLVTNEDRSQEQLGGGGDTHYSSFRGVGLQFPFFHPMNNAIYVGL